MSPAYLLHLRSVMVDVVDAVAKRTGVPPIAIMGKDRHPPVVAARHMAWSQLRELGWSYPMIGEVWGCNHSSVLYAARRAKNYTNYRVAS